MTAASARPAFPDEAPASRFTLPVYDSGRSSRVNAATIAHWMWGDLRAQWCAALADELGASRPLTRYSPHAQQWVAAILCAAAVDAGREHSAGGWRRTLAAIAAATGVERETVLTRHRDLLAIGLSSPRDVPAGLRRRA